MYAFWKFDDFSWGDTRKTAGEKTKKGGIEYEGEFDSSKITMKRWSEFERERRNKANSAWAGKESSQGGAYDGNLGGSWPQNPHGSQRPGSQYGGYTDI